MKLSSINKTSTMTILVALTIMLGAAAAQNTETFDAPKHYKGYRLDWCRTWTRYCGKDAAEAFCQANNYDRVVKNGFAKEEGVGLTTLIGTEGQVCDAEFCDGFDYITCENVENETFEKPTLDGKRLYYCYTFQDLCIGSGKDAADAYCQREKGYEIALDWSKHTMILGKASIIGGEPGRDVVSGWFVPVFKSITCANEN